MTRVAPQKLLLIDRHAGRGRLRAALSGKGYSVVTATSQDDAVEVLRRGFGPDAVLLGDTGAPHPETVAAVRRQRPELPVLLLRGPDSDVPTASDAHRLIAVQRAVAADRIEILLQEAQTTRGQRFEISASADAMIVGSPAMRTIRGLVRQVADTDVPVLITGDSGVGKEIIARTLHEDSDRHDRPFVKVNCAALPDQLLESELFSYEKGAFTGADRDKPGKFKLADGGTIFLDEIGEISSGTQAKLLQVLQDGSYFRLGGQRELRVDARVVSSTNRRLEESMGEGTFRKDLFYRLNVVRIEVPCLRERREEVPLLAEHFLVRYQEEYGREVGPLSETAIQALTRHDWPGNVRELENVVRRMVVLQDIDAGLSVLTPTADGAGQGFDLDSLLGPDGELPPLKEVSKLAALEVEGELIRRALDQTHWNRRQAARLLDISYKALLYKIRDCGITAA